MPPDDTLPIAERRTVRQLDIGMTVREVARLYRVNPDKIRSWIRSGALGAINTSEAACGKPRFIILPHHLEEFEGRRRSAGPAPKPPRRRKRRELIDYYPD